MKILLLVASAVIAVLTVSKVRSQRSSDGVWHSIPNRVTIARSGRVEFVHDYRQHPGP